MGELIELIPLFIIGALCGLASYFTNKGIEAEHKDESTGEALSSKEIIKKILATTIYSGILCAITYAILNVTDFNYLAKVGIASAIALLGIDGALNIVKEFLAHRRGK